MALRTEAGSRRSPVTKSSASPERWNVGLVGLISARTAKPRSTSRRATAEPINPLAPVIRTLSDPCIVQPNMDEADAPAPGSVPSRSHAELSRSPAGLPDPVYANGPGGAATLPAPATQPPQSSAAEPSSGRHFVH